VRPWIFGEDNFTHTGAQTIRTNENIGVIRGPIAKRQPNPIRRSGDTGHAHIEPRIDACGSRLCEQNFDERAAADGDARSAEHALMVRLVGKRKPLAFGVQISMPVVSIPFVLTASKQPIARNPFAPFEARVRKYAVGPVEIKLREQSRCPLCLAHDHSPFLNRMRHSGGVRFLG
jgi:hypothetical protein